MGGSRGSGIVSSEAVVLWMSLVRGMGGVGGVFEMCMGLGRVLEPGSGGVVWYYVSV